jgi:iron complex outermembrane receptor protein
MNHSLNAQLPRAFALKPLLAGLIVLFSGHTIAADVHNVIDLASVPVTGNPLGVGADELIVPISILGGRELSLKRESTLGDTLNGMPGVSATSFGPNASRPVIRGLDAERVRIMQNGIGILDASSLSFDHAVSLDPLVIEQIEVIRGPAALLYGGSAVGGVVNAIDHRIPTEKLDGISGRAEASAGGANSQNNLAGVMDVGNGKIAIHADAYSRKTSDLDIPGYAVSSRKSKADGTVRDNRGRLVNSSSSSDGGALGASLTFDNGYAGISYSGFRNNYGTVAEPTVRADMQSDRWDFASEFKELGTIVDRLKFKLAHTDYQHQEIDSGVVGTTFKNRGVEGSLEAGHANIGNLKGVLGIQFQNSNFEALGDEAFVPAVNTQSKALYIYEELPLDQLKISLGGRLEHVTVDSKNDIKYGPAQNNSFNPASYALGGLYTFNTNWSLATNLSHNERAPSYFELYANGAHLATGQFEIGNPNFDKERSNGIDAQIRWKADKHSFNFGVYYTRFSSFLGLLNTGNIDASSGLPVAQFSSFAATFRGLEADGRFNLADNLDLTVRGDYVRATNQDNGDPLPRIAPLRLGTGLHYQKNSLGARLDILHAFKQDRSAANELNSDGYTNLSAIVSYKLPTQLNLEVFAKANNLLDQEIREHASFLKDIAPQAGRSLLLGLRSDF